MNEEFAENRVPPVGGMGVSMVGPTLIAHGTEEQKKEHLGRILSGEVQWCQGFSEPGSGSDLASLQTRAVQGRRRLRHQRPEDLDVGRAVRALDVHAGAHRPRRAEAQGHQLLPAST